MARHPKSDKIVRLAHLGGAVKRRATVARMHRKASMPVKLDIPADMPKGGSHEPRGCRWISGDTRGNWSYCGARIGSTKRPYCDEHKARMYREAAA